MTGELMLIRWIDIIFQAITNSRISDCKNVFWETIKSSVLSYTWVIMTSLAWHSVLLVGVARNRVKSSWAIAANPPLHIPYWVLPVRWLHEVWVTSCDSALPHRTPKYTGKPASVQLPVSTSDATDVPWLTSLNVQVDSGVFRYIHCYKPLPFYTNYWLPTSINQ